jgi:uncharacterized membrane protein
LEIRSAGCDGPNHLGKWLCHGGHRNATAEALFTVIAACASLFAVIFLLSSAKKTTHFPLHVALSIFAIVAAWSLMHTVFALRYAHAVRF